MLEANEPPFCDTWPDGRPPMEWADPKLPEDWAAVDDK